VPKALAEQEDVPIEKWRLSDPELLGVARGVEHAEERWLLGVIGARGAVDFATVEVEANRKNWGQDM
jgi:hypothetical protein